MTEQYASVWLLERGPLGEATGNFLRQALPENGITTAVISPLLYAGLLRVDPYQAQDEQILERFVEYASGGEITLPLLAALHVNSPACIHLLDRIVESGITPLVRIPSRGGGYLDATITALEKRLTDDGIAFIDYEESHLAGYQSWVLQHIVLGKTA